MRTISDYIHGKLGRVASATALSAALVVGAGAVPTFAHDGSHDNQAAASGLDRRAAFNGYRAGFEHGVEDRNAGEDFDFQHDETFRQATDGYTNGYGSVREYQDAFRQAYERGYSDGYSGRGRDDDFGAPIGHDDNDYDSHDSDFAADVTRQAALNGYRSGLEHGSADRRQRVNFNYQHDEEYRQATTGYRGNGSRWTLQQYQNAFRQAYERGYSDGYYGRGQGSWNDGNGWGGMSQSDVRRLALVRGYNEGFQHGAEDRNDRVGFNYQHDDRFRQATSGYDRRWNMLREYQSAFRQGYARGYSDAYYGRTRNRSYDDRWDVSDYRNR